MQGSAGTHRQRHRQKDNVRPPRSHAEQTLENTVTNASIQAENLQAAESAFLMLTWRRK